MAESSSSNAEDVDDVPCNPLDMYILSHDALRGNRTDQTIPPGWPDRPTRRSAGFLAGAGHGAQTESRDEREALRSMLRGGVPPALRCAVWVTNVFRAARPDMGPDECSEQGTLKKVRILDHGWNVALRQIFPDQSDEADAHPPDFGLGDRHMVNLMLRDHGGDPIPESGADALKRVLCAAEQSLGVEYCPLLPDLAALYLSAMEESYAYATVRTMLEDPSHFWAVSRVDHLALCKTFADLMGRMYPQTHAVLAQVGLLTRNALDPIFKRFFVQLLRREHVLRIVDLYTLDGIEVVFRFGTGLMALFHADMSQGQHFQIADATSWWDGVHNYCHSKRFDFAVLLEEHAYGSRPGRIRRSVPIFPHRSYFERILSDNQDWAETIEASHDDNHGNSQGGGAYEERPLGFLEGDDVPIVLARHAPERQRLAEWLPPSLRSTKLELIYSSDVHGRTVERFYHHASRARHTVTLLEVLGKGGVTVGMFATQTWHRNARGYGNGECFLFRLRPDPACFKWKQRRRGGNGGAEPPSSGGEESQEVLDSTSPIDERGGDSSAASSSDASSSGQPPRQQHQQQHAQRQFADQVMISGDDFISMGIGKDGASGLRLNEDLTRGSTSPAMGFGDESLLPDDSQVFDVGLVEVYRLVREVDGKPVDTMQD